MWCIHRAIPVALELYFQPNKNQSCDFRVNFSYRLTDLYWLTEFGHQEHRISLCCFRCTNFLHDDFAQEESMSPC